MKGDAVAGLREICIALAPGPKKPFFRVPTDELLQAKDDLLSEGGQSLSSLTEQVVKRILNLFQQSSTRMQNLSLGLHQNVFGGRAPPGPAGGAKALPDPLVAIRGPTSKGRGRGGERRGKEGRGRTTCIPHYFRPWLAQVESGIKQNSAQCHS